MTQSSKIALIAEMIDSAQSSLRSAKQMLLELSGKSAQSIYKEMAKTLPTINDDGIEKIVEGVFNGQSMVDNTGTDYPVPANYASKSKLIPGDVLKLTIQKNGTFLYKQIGPIERKRVIGTLTYEDGQYKVIASGRAYKVLLASVTYFKAEIGDKVTLIIPELEDSEWGALENILPEGAEELQIEEE